MGYGDYTGGTYAEYLVSLVFQFTGLFFFSFLMYLITLLVDTDYNFDTFAQSK